MAGSDERVGLWNRLGPDTTGLRLIPSRPQGLRLSVQLPPECSGGVLEWKVEGESTVNK